MALVVADRVQETTTTTGTGTYTLAGAKDGFQSFAAVGDGNTCYYAITDGTDWETGIGTFTLSGTTLARTTIIESSNSDAAVNWGAGNKDIFVTAPADKTLLVGRNLYADNPSSPTTPIATGANDVAIGTQAEATGGAALALGYDAVASGNLALAINDGTASASSTIAIGGQSVASATSSMALGYGTDATGNFSTAVGRNAQATGDSANAFGRDAVSAGNQSTAIGDAYASGTDSFAAAIANNTSSYGATGANSIAMGYQAKATQSNAVSIGTQSQATGSQAYGLGQFGVASATYAYCLGGFSTASGYGSYAIGTSIAATSQYSVAMGRRAKTTVEGQYAFTGEWFSAQGDSQTSTYVLRSDTTDATAEAMVTDGPNETRGTNNQIVLHNNSAFAFHGTIVARESATDGTDCAAWKVEGLIRREGSAGTTTLVNSATTVLDNTPSWGMSLSADTTNGCLKIEVTGAASTNIRWVATINTSEVTYA